VLFRFDPQVSLSQDAHRVCLLLLEAKKERPDYMGRAYGVKEMHHTLFDRIRLGDKRDRGFQKPEYFSAVPLKACENRGGILRTHADHIKSLQESEEARCYEILFRVIS
jgi:hypothetical protein